MKKETRGRKKSKNPANQRVEVCMRVDQKALYEKMADAEGMALTTWMKVVCDKEAGKY